MLGPNITPDPDTGIGKWTADDFYRALHDGINRVGSDMYPTMPYGAYTKVTRADADAIYDYLRTVAPVKSRIDVNHLTFPFNQRWTMAGWRELYFTAGTFVPDPSKSQIWNRGAYLVEGLGHCRDCHSPRNRLGAIDKTKDYQGAAVDGWFALDLSENIATGLGAWSVDDVATFLKTGEFRGKTVAVGPMALVVRNSLSFMTDSDLHAMGVYLKKIPTDSSLRSGQQKPDALQVQGANLYVEYCVGCHQSSGRGLLGIFPPLVGNGAIVADDPGNIVKVILLGVSAANGRVPMPSFGAQMTNEQIATVANYVRTNWGNGAAANATATVVATLRPRAN
jgi:mono/diheme cytochrome c family protein